MTDVVRWGIMGNANIARVCVIPAIRKSGNGRVHTLATRSPDASKSVVEKHRIGRVVDRYEALLDDDRIDAVYIPLPNHLHHHWTLRALAAGKHVLCEKPLACTASQAQEMADTAAAHERLLMEGFMYRFHSRTRQIKQMIDQGRIGELRLVRVAFCYRMPGQDFNDPHNARLNPSMGGGALLDVGCYGVSAARWLFGREPRKASAQAHLSERGVDIHVVGSLQFDGHGLAVIEASFISALQQTFTAVGTKGAIELPHDAFIPWEKTATYHIRGVDQQTGDPVSVAGEDEYQTMVTHFADAVLGRKGAIDFSPRDSVANMKALDALAKSIQTGQTTAVSSYE